MVQMKTGMPISSKRALGADIAQGRELSSRQAVFIVTCARPTDLSIGSDRVRAAAVLPLSIQMMKRLSRLKLPSLRDVGTEARLLLIGIPVFIWTMAADLSHVPVPRSRRKEDAFGRQAMARASDAGTISTSCFTSSIISCGISGFQFWNSTGHRGFGRRADAVHRDRGGFLDLEAARSPVGRWVMNLAAVHLLHPGRVPRRSDVPDHGHLWPPQQSLGG